MNSKHAEGLALQTIVIAALVLVVLIIIVMIFVKGIAPGKKIGGINDCQTGTGETCAQFSTGCPPQTYPISGLAGCPAETPYCCKKSG